MAGNTIGKLFTVTSFGESHGPALGCIVDGCPPGLPLDESDLQADLDRRKPGQSRFTTQRREADAVRILSGVFEGVTTGTPIGLLIENTDQRSKDYSNIKDRFRPAHADYSYTQKYGLRDYRGGGRSSARETAMRVAAGAIAKKYLARRYGVSIRGYLAQLGPIAAQRVDWEEVENNPFFCPDPDQVGAMETFMAELNKRGDSIGARINVVASGVPPGPVSRRSNSSQADSATAIAAAAIHPLRKMSNDMLDVPHSFPLRARPGVFLALAQKIRVQNVLPAFSAGTSRQDRRPRVRRLPEPPRPRRPRPANVLPARRHRSPDGKLRDARRARGVAHS